MTDVIDGVVAGPRPDFAAVVTDELRSALADGDRALREQGDLRAGRQHFERAYQLAGSASDVHAMALAALGGAGLWLGESRTVAGAARQEARLRHALSLLEGGSGLALRIRARLAAEADYSRGANAAILALLDQIRPDSDPVVLAEALSLAHHCLLGPDHVRLRGELADELIRVSFRTERRVDLLTGLLWRTVDAYTAADPHAGRLLIELREHLGPRGHLAIGFVVSALDVLLAIRSGQLSQAEALTQACAENGRAAGDIDSEWWPAAQLVTIRWYQGRLTELLPLLRERAHSPSLGAVDDSALAALAVAAAQDGDRHTAASSLAALCGGDLAGLARSSSWLVTMHGIVEAAFLLDDADVASQAYELLIPYAGLPMIGSLGVTCFGSTQHALGVASLTAGHPDRAVAHLRAAVQQNLALGHWPAVLASRQRLALAYQLRGQPGDADAARRELDTARDEGAPLRLTVPRGPATRPPSPVATCERVGKQWRISVQRRSVLVADSIGLTHLAVLIANPRQEIKAADLVAGLAALSAAVTDGGAAQPMLDREAVTEYRKRLRQLDEQLDRLTPGDDPDRAASARSERDWLTAELAAATGLGRRTRSFPDHEERARIAVGKAVRRALARIGEADPVIGAHLGQTVRTGVRCSYWPDLTPAG